MSLGPDPLHHPRYRSLERIGKGGMGEVFRCLDRLTGQMVALKRVRLPTQDARPAVRRLVPQPDGPNQAPIVRPCQPAVAAAETLDAVDWPATAQASVLPQNKEEAEADEHSRPPSLALPAQVPAWLPTALPGAVDAAGRIQEGALSNGTAAPRRDFDSDVQSLRLHLAQEFRTLASLRHPNIVSVLDYGFDTERQPFFTMELLEGGVPLDVAARSQPLSVRVALLLQILQALAYLHRRSVLHRDLKPSNILVVSGLKGPHVRILDFGLALLMNALHSQFAEVAGTLGYMAPEIFVGVQPSPASDLFAVGVIAHELLLGSHPLGQRPTAALMQEFLSTASLFLDPGGLEPELAAVLRRALSRHPADRYADATLFAQELARATGLSPPAESTEVRESFLQAAAFVAREEELATLRLALAEAAARKGSVWLVGGESGVGKSRLLEELRTLALVRGVRVVRGQAVSSGGALFQVWQAALRPLCLDTPLDEADAGILRAVIPDLAMLTGRTVQDPPALDPQSAQTRLVYAIERLLAAQSDPLLILLEDLHWADFASLTLLSHLVRFATLERHPVLIASSYRTEERPELPSELPGCRLLTLPRLPKQDIEALSISMLGDAGNRRDIVDFITRETEGNALFIVEAVRALAEEVGSLDKVRSARIPSKIVAGGIHAVLARRLGRVPAETRPFLSAAALIGRELDVSVVSRLSGEIGLRWEADLQACATAAVLESHENRWRFAHDKLREAVLSEIPPAVCAQLHLRIGRALEEAYAAELGPHVAALAYHFRSAGDLGHAARYSIQAGERALKSGAVHEAMVHLEECRKLEIQRLLSKPERVHALRLLCQAYISTGRPDECAQLLEDMLAEAGMSVPKAPRELALDTTRLLIGHIVSRLRKRSDDPAPLHDPAERAALVDMVDAYVASLPGVSFSRSQPQFIHLILALVTLAERLGEPVRVACAYTGLASILSVLPFDFLTDDYLRRAKEILDQSPEPLVGELALRTSSAWVYTSRGDWDAARRCLDEELEYYRRVGNLGAELVALSQRFRLDVSCGDIASFREAQTRMEEVAQRVESEQHLCWLWSARGYLAMHSGQLKQATEFFREAQRHEPHARDRLVSAYYGGNAALCALRCGEYEDARRRADATLDAILTAPSFGSGVADAIAPLVETFFILWSKSRSGSERRLLHFQLRKSLAVFRSMAAAFPICRPRALLWHGQYALRLRYGRIGEWLLRQSLTASQRLRMPFDEGLACLALSETALRLGEHVRAQEVRRNAQLLLEGVEAFYYLVQSPVARG